MQGRYGNASGRGRRIVELDEFSKALNPAQAKRLANVKAKRELGPEAVRERRAIYSRIGLSRMQSRAEFPTGGGGRVTGSDGMPRAMRRRGYTYEDAERAMRRKDTTGDAGGVFKSARGYQLLTGSRNSGVAERASAALSRTRQRNPTSEPARARARYANTQARKQTVRLNREAQGLPVTASKSLMSGLRATGNMLKTNYQRGTQGLTKPKLQTGQLTKPNFRAAQAANYVGANQKPLAIGAAAGGTTVGGVAVMNRDRNVNKRERTYNAEAKRQRRLGAATAGLMIGGGFYGRRGIKGIQEGTKRIREASGTLDNVAGKDLRIHEKGKGAALHGLTDKEKGALKEVAAMRGRPVAARPRDLRDVALGGALTAGAVGTATHARSRRNRAWR